MSIAANLMSIQDRVREAARRAGRDPAEVKVVAVTKTVGPEMVAAAYAAGVRDFGENRVQDLRAKFEQRIADDITVHLVGHLQTNKARDAVRYSDIIESIDRPELIEALQKRAERERRYIDTLIQVNISGEDQKHGCTPDQAQNLVRMVTECTHLRVGGFMTIAPLVERAEATRPVFRDLRKLRDRIQSEHPELDLSEMSMGMTNDFEVAIEEGATMIRLGRAIFEG